MITMAVVLTAMVVVLDVVNSTLTVIETVNARSVLFAVNLGILSSLLVTQR